MLSPSRLAVRLMGRFQVTQRWQVHALRLVPEPWCLAVIEFAFGEMTLDELEN